MINLVKSAAMPRKSLVWIVIFLIVGVGCTVTLLILPKLVNTQIPFERERWLTAELGPDRNIRYRMVESIFEKLQNSHKPLDKEAVQRLLGDPVNELESLNWKYPLGMKYSGVIPQALMYLFINFDQTGNLVRAQAVAD